jgi:hypothetical protein
MIFLNFQEIIKKYNQDIYVESFSEFGIISILYTMKIH